MIRAKSFESKSGTSWPASGQPLRQPLMAARAARRAPPPWRATGGLAEVASGWGRSGRGAGPQSAPQEPKIAIGPGESQLQMAILEDY